MSALDHASDHENQSQPDSTREGASERSSPTPSKRFNAGFFLTFILTFIIWLVFSGRFDPFHLALGVVSCGIVAALSGDLLFPSRLGRGAPFVWLRFIGYIPWLLYQIFLANIHVMHLVFHPRMMDLIDPQVIEFNSKLTKDISRATFANSITLTPGTITINATAIGKFSVHCINAESGKPLPGEMEARIARIFEE